MGGLTSGTPYWDVVFMGSYFVFRRSRKDSCENRKFFALLGAQREIATNDLMDHFFAFYQRVIMTFFVLGELAALDFMGNKFSEEKKSPPKSIHGTNLQ